MMRNRPETLLTACGSQARRLDYERYLCALFAPRRAREALFAILAFNGEIARVRERVSEPIIGQIRLQWWREAIDDIYTGQRRRHDVLSGLGEALERFDLGREHFDALIDAREFDMEERAPATLDELEAYCEETSARLLYLWGEVLAPDAAREHRTGLREVGIAWALTGLLRAAAFHARQERRYLPDDLMREEGARESDYREMRQGPALTKVARRIAACAAGHLDTAHGAVKRPPAALWPAFAPAILADDHLKGIAKRGYALFDRPVEAGVARRQVRLLLARSRRRY